MIFQYQARAGPLELAAGAVEPDLASPHIVDGLLASRLTLFQYQQFAGPFDEGSTGTSEAVTTPIIIPEAFQLRRLSFNVGIYIDAANTMPPDPLPGVQRVTPRQYVVHEIDDDNPRTRKALQQATDILNNLQRSGEITGPFREPKLGYQPDSIADWGVNPPYTVKEALDALIARIKALE